MGQTRLGKTFMFKAQSKENNRCWSKRQSAVVRLLSRCQPYPTEEFVNSIPRTPKQVMVKTDPQDVMGTAIWLVRHPLFIKNSSQVIGSVDNKDKKKEQKESNVPECKTDSNDDTNVGRHVLVSEEHTRAESHRRDQNRQTLHLVQAVEFWTIRTAHRLKEKNKKEKEHDEDMLQIGTQRVRENDDHCQNSLSEHNHRFPEHIVLLVGAVQETARLVDPSALVVLFDVFSGKESSG